MNLKEILVNPKGLNDDELNSLIKLFTFNFELNKDYKFKKQFSIIIFHPSHEECQPIHIVAQIIPCTIYNIIHNVSEINGISISIINTTENITRYKNLNSYSGTIISYNRKTKKIREKCDEYNESFIFCNDSKETKLFNNCIIIPSIHSYFYLNKFKPTISEIRNILSNSILKEILYVDTEYYNTFGTFHVGKTYVYY